MKIFLSALLGVVAFGSIVFFITKPPSHPKEVKDITELETYFDRLVKSNVPPGLSIVITKNDNVVYAKSFGLADGPNQIPATMDTVYHCWSMTKIPTAIAILQLQEKGLLDIDDPVEKYLPFFQVEYKGTQIHEITIHQLLSHTSGLPDPVPAIIGWVHYEDKIYDQTELVKQNLPDYNQLKYAPGSDSSYSNLGYMVLGAVIEAVSGQSYENYVIEHVLKPANMSQTNFLYTDTMQKHEAFGSQPLINLYTPMLLFLMDIKPLIRERGGAMAVRTILGGRHMSSWPSHASHRESAWRTPFRMGGVRTEQTPLDTTSGRRTRLCNDHANIPRRKSGNCHPCQWDSARLK
ncbi:MAG: serine hydrolase [Anaerolineales bacterium]